MQPTARKLSQKIGKNGNINSSPDGRRQINNTPHEPLPQYGNEYNGLATRW